MTFDEKPADKETPLLEIELVGIANGCLARLSGDLVSETRAVLWGIEPMLANEARVALDLSGVTSVDGAGLEAALRLMYAVHTFGGTVTFGGERTSCDACGLNISAPGPTPADASSWTLRRLSVHLE
jgi:ABC-type transporter Mla MlaB component